MSGKSNLSIVITTIFLLCIGLSGCEERNTVSIGELLENPHDYLNQTVVVKALRWTYLDVASIEYMAFSIKDDTGIIPTSILEEVDQSDVHFEEEYYWTGTIVLSEDLVWFEVSDIDPV